MKKQLLLLLVGVFGCLFTAVNPLSAQIWVQTTAPPEGWVSIACSADGNKLVAVEDTDDSIYTSTNFGATWTQTSAPFLSWSCVASSADGGKLVAVVNGGGIYTSTNSGVTWTLTSAPTNAWSSVASSADGSELVAAVNGGGIYTSTDSGATWTLTSAPNASWACIASSSDGTKLAAVAASAVAYGYPKVYISTNSGTTWYSSRVVFLPMGISGSWSAVRLSADGTKLVVAAYFLDQWGSLVPGSIYTSTDSGTTWITGLSGYWTSVASSADGTRLVAATTNSIYTSTNSGATWTQTTNAPSGTVGTYVASSADGSKLVAAIYNGRIYTYGSLTTPGGPVLNLALPSNNLAFSWIVPSTDFVLQQNSDLCTTYWTDITNTPTLNPTNLQNQVTLPLPAGNAFYRLKTP
jgi:photosystem II stability/assembly factor-like uncharacterized protein